MVQSEGDDIFGYISCLYSIFSVLPATCIFLHDWSVPTSITAIPCWYLLRVPCWRSDPVTRLRVLGRLLAKMYQPQEHGYFRASPVLFHATCGWLVQKMFLRMTFALLTVVSANYFLQSSSQVLEAVLESKQIWWSSLHSAFCPSKPFVCVSQQSAQIVSFGWGAHAYSSCNSDNRRSLCALLQGVCHTFHLQSYR